MRFPTPTSPDLATWLEVELPALTARAEPSEYGPTRPLTRGQLLADDADALRDAHRCQCAEGATPQAGAMYLAGWFGGGPARRVGLALATAGAGLLLDPEHVIYDIVEAEGWPENIRPIRARALVPPGHPWDGTPDVEVVAADQVLPRTMAALVEFAEPVVAACRRLAKVNKAGLWDEVADPVVCCLSNRENLTITPEMEQIVTAAVATPGMPWKSRPQLVWAESTVLGRMLIAHKGGCCFAFTCKHEPTPEEDLSPALREWRRRFGGDKPGKQYCSTCCFRETADVVERRVAWAEIKHLHEVS